LNFPYPQWELGCGHKWAISRKGDELNRPVSIPAAAEKLRTDLKAAAEAASQLEDADPDGDRASLLVGIRNVLDYSARV
jgi:hypothetical protein